MRLFVFINFGSFGAIFGMLVRPLPTIRWQFLVPSLFSSCCSFQAHGFTHHRSLVYGLVDRFDVFGPLLSAILQVSIQIEWQKVAENRLHRHFGSDDECPWICVNWNRKCFHFDSIGFCSSFVCSLLLFLFFWSPESAYSDAKRIWLVRMIQVWLFSFCVTFIFGHQFFKGSGTSEWRLMWYIRFALKHNCRFRFHIETKRRDSLVAAIDDALCKNVRTIENCFIHEWGNTLQCVVDRSQRETVCLCVCVCEREWKYILTFIFFQSNCSSFSKASDSSSR